MADPVAIVSVVSSGLVALGGLYVNYRSGREQRKHEKRLSFEEHVWERKSEGLFGAIAASRVLLDTLDSRAPHDAKENLPLRLVEIAERLDDLLPVVEAYGSSECRYAFEDLRALLKSAAPDPRTSAVAYVAARGKEKAIDEADFAAASGWRDREKKALREMREALDLDLDEVRSHASRVIATSRESLREAE